MNPMDRYKQLTKTIREHMDYYYNQDDPKITDQEYDDLM